MFEPKHYVLKPFALPFDEAVEEEQAGIVIRDVLDPTPHSFTEDPEGGTAPDGSNYKTMGLMPSTVAKLDKMKQLSEVNKSCLNPDHVQHVLNETACVFTYEDGPCEVGDHYVHVEPDKSVDYPTRDHHGNEVDQEK